MRKFLDKAVRITNSSKLLTYIKTKLFHLHWKSFSLKVYNALADITHVTVQGSALKIDPRHFLIEKNIIFINNNKVMNICVLEAIDSIG